MKKSFTLLELLVVLLIISLLVSLVAPKGFVLFNSFKNKIKSKEKFDRIEEIKFDCFLKIEGNKSLRINKYGIKKESFFNH
jgi:prepilin-type N-terminal cleavage/methylation domain-containing protein